MSDTIKANPSSTERSEGSAAAPWPSRGMSSKGRSSTANQPAAFESVILPADLGPTGGKGAKSATVQPSVPATTAPSSTVPAPMTQPAPLQPRNIATGVRPAVPAPQNSTASDVPMVESVEVLQKIGPEHFKRTLIAPMRAPIVPQSGDGTQQLSASPRAVQITPHAVVAALNDARLYMLRDPDSLQAAAFRVLRYRLIERGDPRTILVTSAEVGDGKSTCAINLAIALSECGRARVLLLEANFRRPAIARMLGMTPPVCGARQITEQHHQPGVKAWQMAQVTSPWLHVLAVDTDTFHRPTTMDEPAFQDTLAQLKTVGYDYIVIDTPPVLGSADVNLLQDVADAVVLSLWARTSKTSALTAALDQLTPSKVVGSVLLDV